MEWILDTERKLVHRRSQLTPACGLDRVAPGSLQERGDQLDAMLAMKTRHYLPCPHCHA